MTLLTTRALKPFGIELIGDLTEPLSQEQQQQFRRLFFEHGLVLARGQSLSREAQLHVGSYIAPPITDGDAEYISNMRADDVFGSSGLAFHSDNMYSPEPHVAVALHAVDVSDGATRTDFASTTRAARDIPAGLRARCLGRDVRLILSSNFAGRNRLADQAEIPGTEWPQRWWPMITRHPETGREIVTVSLNGADAVSGLDVTESEQLLTELFEVLYQMDAIYSHTWRNGDVIYWDNLAVQHGRPPIPPGVRRTLQRGSFGGRGFAETFPKVVEWREGQHMR